MAKTKTKSVRRTFVECDKLGSYGFYGCNRSKWDSGFPSWSLWRSLGDKTFAHWTLNQRAKKGVDPTKEQAYASMMKDIRNARLACDDAEADIKAWFESE